MKISYELSYLAQDDIDKIWVYTFETWSKVQANKYFKELFKTIETICQNPEIGYSISYIKADYRIMKFKSHLIVYKFSHQTIFIDRVLHEKMDIENRILE